MAHWDWDNKPRSNEDLSRDTLQEVNGLVCKLFHKHLPAGSYDESGGRGWWGEYPDGKRRYTRKGTGTDWGVTHQDEAEMSDAKAAKWAIDRLEEEHQQPFFH